MTYQLSKYFAKGAGHAIRHQNKAQIAYEEDCRRCPNYHTGEKRKAWADLGSAEQDSWRRNPTPREFAEPLVVTRSFYETLRRIGPHATRNIASE